MTSTTTPSLESPGESPGTPTAVPVLAAPPAVGRGRVRAWVAAVGPGDILAAVLLVALPVAAVAPMGVSAVVALGAAGLAVLLGCERRWPTVAGGPAVVVLALLCGLGMVSAAWAVDPSETVKKTVQFTGIGLAGLLLLSEAGRLTGSDRRRVLLALLIGTGIAAVIVIGTAAVMPWLPTGLTPESYRFKNAGTVGAVLAWPIFLAAAGRWGRPGLAIGLLVVGLMVFAGHSTTAAVALAGGSGVFLLAHWRPRLTAVAVAAGLVAVLAGMPLLARSLPDPTEVIRAVPVLANSAHHRLRIWRFVGERIGEKPLTGWGLAASRAIPGGKETVRVHVRIPGRALEIDATEELLPLHPHSGSLQIWLELGVPGALLTAALIIVLARGSPPPVPPLRSGPLGARSFHAARLASLAAAGAIANASYSIHQTWWVGALWLAAVAIVLVAPGSDREDGRGARADSIAE